MSDESSRNSVSDRNDPILSITRRRLPHWVLEGSTYFVTFRLAGGSLIDEEIFIVLEHIKSGDPQFYLLISAVVMPDHVHLILTPKSGYSLSRIMKGIKGVTAHKINAMRKSEGATLWQAESYDRIVRNEQELQEKVQYMLMNPVKSGLIEDGWAYPGFHYKP